MPPPGGPPPGAYQQYTPGGIASGPGQPAKPEMRLLARFIDCVIVALVGTVIAVAFGLSAFGTRGVGTSIAIGVVASVLSVAVVLAYEILMVGMNKGQTVGKLAVGIRVVNRDGSPLDVNGAIKRHTPSIIGRALYIIPIIGGLFGALVLIGVAIANIVMVFQNGESLYDKLGNTMVVTTK